MMRFQTANPKELGIDPSGLNAFLSSARESGLMLNSVLLLRHGKLGLERYFAPFSAERKHNLYSCTKSFTSTAVGFAIDEGLLSLESRVTDLLPERVRRPPHPYLAATTVRHLLQMTHPFERLVSTETDDWTQEFFDAVPTRYPGAAFLYDTACTHVLSEIVQRVTGTTLMDYLRPRLFAPLGIADAEWEVSPTGICRGGGGLRITSRAMAAFGQLYLNHGEWEGRRVLPQGWAELATARHVDNTGGMPVEGNLGYGFQFWRGRNDSFACIGLGGQIILVLPRCDMVFVTTGNAMLEDGGRYLALELFWQHIYPGVGRVGSAVSVMEEPCECVLPLGERTSSLASGISGKRFALEANPLGYTAFRLELDETAGALTLEGEGYVDALPFGVARHVPSENPLHKYQAPIQWWGRYTFPSDPEPRRRARCGTAAIWTDQRTLVIQSHLTDTVQSYLIKCHFGREAYTVSLMPYGVYAYDVLPCTLTHIVGGQD